MSASSSRPASESPAPGDAALDPVAERRTTPLELLWDLVFVFAVTQVTALISHRIGWGRIGEGLLVLALVWWAWSAFVWVANAEPDDSRVLRLCLLSAAVFILICGLALPQAFGAEGLLFAVTYALVRVMHLMLYAVASRGGRAAWSAIVGFAITVLVGMALLIVGALVPGTARALLWLAAVAIDYAGPAWITRARLRSLQRVAVTHFAERYSLFVIICLGESVVAVGVGARSEPVDAALVASVGLGLLVTIGMWWTYFERSSRAAELRLSHHRDPVIAASDSYSYLHLPIVAGIIVFAVGAGATVRDVGHTLSSGPRLCLGCGVALYLLGLAAFRLRLLAERDGAKLVCAAALIVLCAVGAAFPAWVLMAGAAALVGLLCAAETLAAPGAAPT